MNGTADNEMSYRLSFRVNIDDLGIFNDVYGLFGLVNEYGRFMEVTNHTLEDITDLNLFNDLNEQVGDNTFTLFSQEHDISGYPYTNVHVRLDGDGQVYIINDENAANYTSDFFEDDSSYDDAVWVSFDYGDWMDVVGLELEEGWVYTYNAVGFSIFGE